MWELNSNLYLPYQRVSHSCSKILAEMGRRIYGLRSNTWLNNTTLDRLTTQKPMRHTLCLQFCHSSNFSFFLPFLRLFISLASIFPWHTIIVLSVETHYSLKNAEYFSQITVTGLNAFLQLFFSLQRCLSFYLDEKKSLKKWQIPFSTFA